MEEKQEEEPIEQEPEQEKKKQVRLRSLRSQIQATLDSLEAISNDPKQKKNCQSDAALKRADLLLDLSRLDHKKEVDAALVENAAFHEQLDAKDRHIAELESECAQLRNNQHPVRVEVQQDPEAAEVRRRLANANDIIENAGQAIRENVEEPSRLKIASALVRRMGKGAQALVTEIADWASIVTFSQKSDDDLQEIISSAFVGSRGPAVQLARATLAVRGIETTGPRSSKPVYGDVFDQVDNGTF